MVDLHRQVEDLLRDTSLSHVDPTVAQRGRARAMAHLARAPHDPAAQAMAAWFDRPEVVERLHGAPLRVNLSNKLRRHPNPLGGYEVRPRDPRLELVSDQSFRDMETIETYATSLEDEEESRARRMASIAPSKVLPPAPALDRRPRVRFVPRTSVFVGSAHDLSPFDDTPFIAGDPPPGHFYSGYGLLRWVHEHGTRRPLTIDPLLTPTTSVRDTYAPTVRALNALGRQYPLAQMLAELQARGATTEDNMFAQDAAEDGARSLAQLF